MKGRATSITYPALFAALGVVLLLLGSFFSMLDLTMAALACLPVTLATIEFGKRNAFFTYLVTALLACLLCPQKNGAVFYTFFFGAYPIWKSVCEQRRRVIGFVFKESFYIVTFACTFLTCYFLLGTWSSTYPFWYGLVLFLAGNLVFWLFDVALGRLISLYMWRFRHRMPFARKK